VQPVYVGDTLQVRLTCKSKAAKDDREGQVPQGVVAWDVEVSNQAGEAVAIYTVLTLVKRLHPIGGPAAATDAAAPAVTVTEQPGAAPALMA
jgi:oxepin-CoA hydrolase/3-oxo-5,6-dehydrosuberyl-CoA semialdehyde dehydrogenase